MMLYIYIYVYGVEIKHIGESGDWKFTTTISFQFGTFAMAKMPRDAARDVFPPRGLCGLCGF